LFSSVSFIVGEMLSWFDFPGLVGECWLVTFVYFWYVENFQWWGYMILQVSDFVGR
jgi:hypothetical protein